MELQEVNQIMERVPRKEGVGGSGDNKGAEFPPRYGIGNL